MLQLLQKLSPTLLKPEFYENPENPCRLIVEMATPQTFRIAEYVEANEGKVHRRMRLIPLMAVEVPYSAIQLMALSPHVRKIWPDTKVRTLLDVAVPTVGGGRAHDLGFTGKGVTVAVIDTGISPHPDLMYPENRIVAWKDLLNEGPIPYDDNGHGTHVSGIIAGSAIASHGKYVGMVPDAKLVGIKALDQDGVGNTSDIIAAIEWCIENQKTYNIRVINLSLGAAAEESYREDPLCRTTTAAWNSGIVVCVAAGNDGPDPKTINTPGINPMVITVGNLDDKGTDDVSDDVINDSSSRGPTIDNIVKPDLLAPGTNIMSLRVGWGYRSLSGTSMATPMVTGAVAQLLQKDPSLKPNQVKEILRKNARDLDSQSTYKGPGVLKIDTALEEPKKEAGNGNSLFSFLFGKDSIFTRLFGEKTAVGRPSYSEPNADAPKNFNLAPLLLLLPLMLI